MRKGQFESTLVNILFWLAVLGVVIYIVINYVVAPGSVTPGAELLAP